MQYPNITLKIKNQVPSIELRKEEGESQKILSASKGLDTLILELADALELSNSGVAEMWEMVRTGDEQKLKFGDIDFEKSDLEFEHLLETVNKHHSAYEAPSEAETEELRSELLNFWKQDALASFIEEVYNTLIARAFYLASEMAVDVIVLDDDRLEPHLREKMAKELGEVDEVEFMVA